MLVSTKSASTLIITIQLLAAEGRAGQPGRPVEHLQVERRRRGGRRGGINHQHGGVVTRGELREALDFNPALGEYVNGDVNGAHRQPPCACLMGAVTPIVCTVCPCKDSVPRWREE